jgi:cysteine peptidase C11 family protein
MEGNKKEPAGDALKDWTVMVYLGGDNNLSEECLWSIKEMYRVGVSPTYAVVAQYDSGGGIFLYDLETIKKPKNVGGNKAAQLSLDRNDDTDGSLGDRHAKQQWIKQSASVRNLVRFVKYCVGRYPAKHYMLVLAGHGGGAVGRYLMSEGYPPGHFSINELAVALVAIKNLFEKRDHSERLDILGLDACAMSMAEVGYQIKGLANYMVGAEGLEPATGWPYHRVLEELKSNPAIDPKSFATKIVEKYVTYYSDYEVAGRSVDQAVCNLDDHKTLFKAFKLLAKKLTKAIDDPRVEEAVILAHWRAQSYKFEEYVDLWDFCDLLAASRVGAELRAACKAVRDAIHVEAHGQHPASGYVVKSCFSGPIYQHSHGLSIYLPWVLDRTAMKNYREGLFLSKDSEWGDFVEKYVCLTQRRPRRCGNGEHLGDVRSTQPARGRPSGKNRLVDPYSRLVDPYTKLVDPYTKGELFLEGRVKNPPIYAKRCDCEPAEDA